MTKKKQKQKKMITKPSVIPIYTIGIIWVIYPFLFSFYRWYDFIIVLVVSILAYFLMKKIFRNRTVEVEAPEEEEQRPLTEFEKMLAEGDLYLDFLKKSGRKIFEYNTPVAEQVIQLEKIFARILDHVRRHPEKQNQIRRCIDYYLPTVMKFLNSYQEIHEKQIKGDYTDKITSNVEGVLHTTVTAFSRLEDKLYADTQLDISSDIKVLEHFFEQEGLTDR